MTRWVEAGATTQGHQALPATPGARGEAGGTLPPEAQRGHSCCLKPPGVWHLVQDTCAGSVERPAFWSLTRVGAGHPGWPATLVGGNDGCAHSTEGRIEAQGSAPCPWALEPSWVLTWASDLPQPHRVVRAGQWWGGARSCNFRLEGHPATRGMPGKRGLCRRQGPPAPGRHCAGVSLPGEEGSPRAAERGLLLGLARLAPGSESSGGHSPPVLQLRGTGTCRPSVCPGRAPPLAGRGVPIRAMRAGRAPRSKQLREHQRGPADPSPGRLQPPGRAWPALGAPSGGLQWGSVSSAQVWGHTLGTAGSPGPAAPRVLGQPSGASSWAPGAGRG